mmetsp:Transcript_22328/g.51743  ORF Transcript_22328/g.51743 Transcript_22328/m.51743 type:complete len:281 (+) Transcript_22328:360-1202(+)
MLILFSAAHSQMGTSSAEIKLPQSCCTASMAFSSQGYVTSTASSALIGCTGPAKEPMASRAARAALLGMDSMPSSSTPTRVAPMHQSVTDLYSLFRSTRPPRMMPPITMATSKPAPARSTSMASVKPARCSFRSMKAPTTLVTAIEVTKAAKGGRNPGVRSSRQASCGKLSAGFSACFSPPTSCFKAPLCFSARSFSSSDADGGVGGRSWKKTREAAATTVEMRVMNTKYVLSPASEPPMAPPAMKAAAMPTWLKLMATAVDMARSSGANHVAESSGGVH